MNDETSLQSSNELFNFYQIDELYGCISRFKSQFKYDRSLSNVKIHNWSCYPGGQGSPTIRERLQGSPTEVLTEIKL